MKRLVSGAVLLWIVAAASQAQQAPARSPAQQASKPVLPTEMIPPPGMCRIWLKDVPAKQQPAPTDCATATRTKPANAYLYYGDDYAKKVPVKAPTGTVGVRGSPLVNGLVAPQTVKPPVVTKPPIKPPGG